MSTPQLKTTIFAQGLFARYIHRQILGPLGSYLTCVLTMKSGADSDGQFRMAAAAEKVRFPSLGLAIYHTLMEALTGSQDRKQESVAAQQGFQQQLTEFLSTFEAGATLPKAVEDTLWSVFSSMKSMTSSAQDPAFIPLCRSLVTSFSTQGHWAEMAKVIESAMCLVWPDVLAIASEPTLPGKWADFGDMAMDLARSYIKLEQSDKAALIYQRIIQLAQDPAVSELVDASGREAFSIWESLGKTDRMVHTRQDLLNFHLATKSTDHPMIVEEMYKLASLCQKSGQNERAIDMYQQIADRLQSADCHDHRALPALRALITMHINAKNWVQAQNASRALWTAFMTKGRDYDFTPAEARELYTGYSNLLGQVSAQPNVLYQVKDDYRRGCITAFGEKDPVTIEAASLLAKSSDVDKAVRIYEWIFDLPATADGEPRDVAAMELRQFYQDHIADEWDQQRVTRAKKILTKHYMLMRPGLDSGSIASLPSLVSFARLLTKEGSPDSRRRALAELHQATSWILHSGSNAKLLNDFARELASSYLTNGFRSEALGLVNGLREQTIFGGDSAPNLTPSQARSRLIFLTALEVRLTDSLETFASFHSIALHESLLWQAFQSLKDDSGSPGPALIHGAKLRSLLRSRSSPFAGGLEESLLELFSQNYGAAFGQQTPKQMVTAFIMMLLHELSNVQADADITRVASTAIPTTVKRLISKKDFSAALAIAAPGVDFLRFVDASSLEINVAHSFDLAMMLGTITGREATAAQNLSKTIMHELMQNCRLREFSFDNTSMDQLSAVASMLGQQENYEDLEVCFFILRDTPTLTPTYLSGCSIDSGCHARSAVLSAIARSSSSAVVWWMSVSSTVIRILRLILLRTFFTTCVTSTVLRIPRLSR